MEMVIQLITGITVSLLLADWIKIFISWLNWKIKLFWQRKQCEKNDFLYATGLMSEDDLVKKLISKVYSKE